MTTEAALTKLAYVLSKDQWDHTRKTMVNLLFLGKLHYLKNASLNNTCASSGLSGLRTVTFFSAPPPMDYFPKFRYFNWILFRI